jgi:hypothetical protein
MTTVNLIPPADGGHSTITVNGRTYASTPGVAIPVPDFDAAILGANGWTIQPATAAVNSTTSAVTAATTFPVVTPGYYFQTIVNPQSTSQATVEGLFGEAVYAATAAAITGPGHIIGNFGHLTNYNVTYTLPLGIGVEGRIDNYGLIGTATAFNANTNNTNTIANSYGVFSDIATNTGTITTGFGYGLDIGFNTGTISSFYGYYFPPLSAPANIPLVIGYFFNNNPGITGTKYAFYCADAGAAILTVGPIKTTNTANLGVFTVATLPAGATGDMARVSDALAPAYGATLAGGGAVSTLAYKTATAWTAH